jgi:hypothetical protein
MFRRVLVTLAHLQLDIGLSPGLAALRDALDRALYLGQS